MQSGQNDQAGQMFYSLESYSMLYIENYAVIRSGKRCILLGIGFSIFSFGLQNGDKTHRDYASEIKC